MKASCIFRPLREPVAILRKSFIAICEGDRCAAMLLNNFEYWHNIKLGQSEQEVNRARDDAGYKPNLSLWVYKSADDLTSDLLGEYGRNKILLGVAVLVKLKFIQTRADSSDKFKRGRWFQLDPDEVNNALRKSGLILNPRSFENGLSTVDNRDESDLNLNPLIRKEITSEKGRAAACPDCGGSLYVLRTKITRGIGASVKVRCPRCQ